MSTAFQPYGSHAYNRARQNEINALGYAARQQELECIRRDPNTPPAVAALGNPFVLGATVCGFYCAGKLLLGVGSLAKGAVVAAASSQAAIPAVLVAITAVGGKMLYTKICEHNSEK